MLDKFDDQTTSAKVNSDKVIPVAALIDIKVDKSTEIHTDFSSNEFENAPVKQLLWGSYKKKPVAQIDLDHLVIKACQEIASNTDTADHDFRPRIKDLNSGICFLIDTGAALSVFPKSDDHSEPMDENKGLQAINGTKIPTFGTKTIKVRFNKKTFAHKMTVAPIQQAILGWDFIMAFKFDLLWTNGQFVLFCSSSKSSYPLQLGRVSRSNLNLAPIEVSFKQYSQAQKSPPVSKPIPP